MNDHGDVSITVERRDRVALVSLVGDVDFRSAARLREALTDLLVEGHDRIVVDLSGLSWMDSVGLGVLVACWKRARTSGTSLVLWRPSAQPAAVLRISRIDRVMTVVEDGAVDPFAA